MRLIGLTGGIGTGKTTVSNYLNKTYHLPIWDADIYARKAVQPGSLILDSIIEHYGTDILLPNGNLNRQKLGEIVFNDREELLWLEKQIHPYVRDRFEQNIQQFVIQNNEPGYHTSGQYPTAVLVVPLLFEAKMTDLVTEIWVTYTSPQQQIERLMKRDGSSQEQAYTRINNQMPLENKCQQADVVLDNSSTLEILLKQVDSAIATPSSPE
ncbi:MAG: dephospho-CoA kinase [Cyanobacteriota bacterium]|nr:dephospho-CoA kinase [Cyanobacteriota bacterium]